MIQIYKTHKIIISFLLILILGLPVASGVSGVSDVTDVIDVSYFSSLQWQLKSFSRSSYVPQTHYVGPGQEFKNIQEAVDIARPLDNILIDPGDYYENLTINKTLYIKGSGPDLTRIFSYKNECVINLQANQSVLKDISVFGYGSFSGLMIVGDKNQVSNCIFAWNVIGISFKESKRNIITNCTCIENTGAGIYLGGGVENTFVNTNCNYTLYGSGINLWGSTKNVFKDGYCCNNGDDGFYAYWLSGNNQIKNYTLSVNEGSGVYILDSDEFLIDNCTAEQNYIDGFSISSYRNIITNCTSRNNNRSGFFLNHLEDSKINNCLSCFNNKMGLYLKYASRNIISNNTVLSNFDRGINLSTSCQNNKIFRNSLINNKDGWNQVRDIGKNNKWFYHGVGNYYWDYKYHYPNSTEIDYYWNISYAIVPKQNVFDKFPLVHPYIDYSYLDGLQTGLWDDSDADLVFDLLDVFPMNSTEWRDSDNDGWGDNFDKFPLDPAAAVDSDGDKYPDFWNQGMTEKDSNSGLTIDDFPEDPNKWEKEEDEYRDRNDPVIYSIIGFLIIMIIILIIGLYVKFRYK